jgi:long-chain acyl-CoA synthetase
VSSAGAGKHAVTGVYDDPVRAHLASLVEEFRRRPRDTAVVVHRGNRRYPTTYGDLADMAGRFAAELERQGVAAGERVVLWGENSAEWIAVFFGCLLRGVIVVPLDAAGSAEFARRVVAEVQARLVAGDRALLDRLPDTTPRIDLARLTTQTPAEPLWTVSPAVDGHSPFQIVFTSGTTSEPKGVVHTHRNVLASLQPIENEIAKYSRYERFVHPLRFLHSLPLSHVFGQFMGLWIPALLHAELHFSDQLEPARVVAVIHRERISVFIAVPRVLGMLRLHLLRQFGSLADDLARTEGLPIHKRWWFFRRVHGLLGWKFWAVISGGATMPEELETFWNRLGYALIQGYGLSETAALVTLNHPFHISRGSVGKALPGREVKIGEDGEILVRGEMLAQNEWRGGAMRARESEWLATGDLAEQAPTGELRFLGRKGDVIVTGAGMNVHPADLEGAMLKQAGVRGCVVVGCETPSGPEPVAIVLFAGSPQQMQAAVAEANRGLAEYQRMRRVLLWPEAQFPYTSTGKLLRRKVRDWACATLSGAPPPETGSGDALLGLIAEVTGERFGGAPDDRLRLAEDLRLDSLGRVQLQSAFEQKMGVEIEEDAIAAAGTLGDLRALVAAASVPSPPPVVNVTDAAAEPTAARSEDSPDIYPHWPWSWPAQVLRVVFIELILRPLVWILAAPKVRRAIADPPAGALLVIANHVTAYDGALILYALPWRLRRRLAVAMSGEMLADFRRGRGQKSALRNLFAPLAYWLVTALFNVFPLPRLHGFRRSFSHAGDALDRGFSVLIFPEGTRSRDGKLHTFRPGTGLLARQSAVPVLPVALLGLGELRAAKTSWVRSGTIEVRIGEPIPVDAATDFGHLTARFEQSIRQLQS